MKNHKNKILIFFLILLNLYFLFYIFSDKEVEGKDSYIKELEEKIELIEREKIQLKVERDSLIKVSDSLSISISKSKKKTSQILENRDKKNIIIRSMPDDQLFREFSKFDSLNNRNRQ